MSCKNSNEGTSQKDKHESHIDCSEKGCEGIYAGLEFKNDSDIAHQFSNKMAKAVGDELKNLYKKGLYTKVDFTQIAMSTSGMGTGEVHYKLSIPFIRVKGKCDAFTSFDHVGGWGHTPALKKRTAELQGALLEGEELSISDLKTTKEGLQEYWIQWKNKAVQAECAK